MEIASTYRSQCSGQAPDGAEASINYIRQHPKSSMNRSTQCRLKLGFSPLSSGKAQGKHTPVIGVMAAIVNCVREACVGGC
jgi:hypothetical protein